MLIEWFEKFIVRFVAILVAIMTTVAAFWLAFILAHNTWERAGNVTTALELQEGVQRAMSGVFVVLLGLELLETLKAYRRDHRFRLEIVIVVGAIAVARHIIQLDFHHTDGAFLAGLGVLIASLVFGYYFLRRTTDARGNLVKAPGSESK